MIDNNFKSKIEELSEFLVLMDETDIQDLGLLLRHLETVANFARDADITRIALVSKKIIDDIEKVILEESDEPAKTFELLNDAVSLFQLIVRDGQDPETVVFPEELKFNVTEKDPVNVKKPSGVPNLPDNVDESIFLEFIGRQEADLLEFESMILALEDDDPDNKLPELKRFIHTLKGESGLMGLADSEHVCHVAEDLIEVSNASQLIDILLKVKDWLYNYFKYYTGVSNEIPSSESLVEIINNKLKTPISSEKVNVPVIQKESKSISETMVIESSDSQKEEIFKMLKDAFDNSPNPLEGDIELLSDFITESGEHLEAADSHLLILENDSKNDESLNAVFRAFHTIKGVAGFLDLKMIGKFAHESENLLDLARKGDVILEGNTIDVVFRIIDCLREIIAGLQNAMVTGETSKYNENVPELVLNIRKVISGDSISIEAGRPTVEKITPSGMVDSKKLASSVEIQKSSDIGTKIQAKGKIKEFVKVDSIRLDKMVNTIGELVIAESMIHQLILDEYSNDAGPIRTRLGQLDKITRELQEMGTSLRMVPVKPVFQKMARLVRDLSKKMNKPVEFIMVGEDTELDKTVVDLIGDPLVHLVRNSMDHGIEDDNQARVRAGKPQKGRVELRSYNAGGNIFIEIEDDGKGLDKDVILKKAIKQNIIKENDKLTDREIFNLIFQAGFSTAKKVTDVSGRGVGMDVVKKNITALRGRVEITSKQGKGSVFSIVLPLTLAIIEGMIIGVGQEKYIIPTLSIVTSIQPTKSQIKSVMKKGEILDLKGELIPLFRLEKLFKVSGAIKNPTKGLVVIIEHDGKRSGILTDKLIGQSQIVIKSLGESMHGIAGLSGGAILPDGKVGLILDIGGIIKIAHEKK